MADHDYVTSYPYLGHLLGGWFHQDFDLVGDSLEEIVGDFRATSPAEDLAGLHADISRLLRLHGDRLEAAFGELFGEVVEFSGWGLSARQWLERVDALAAGGGRD
jgi:hypothetical protein